MNKVNLIIFREYTTRVRKKSFIIMTILGPVLTALLFLTPVLMEKFLPKEASKILIADEHPEIFKTILPSSESVTFINTGNKLEELKRSFNKDSADGILFIPADIIRNTNGIILFTEKQANIQVSDYIENTLQDYIEKSKLKSKGIEKETLESINTPIHLRTYTLKGEKNNAALTTIVGFIGAIAIYFFILLYGIQVMRGVIEEKTNRIVELIISSVKPFELMMGKIIGIALVGLTQFSLWIILTMIFSGGISYAVNQRYSPDKINRLSVNSTPNSSEHLSDKVTSKSEPMRLVFENLNSINIPLVLFCFLIYFLGGYLLYGALFAAIGAAVDNDTETQQFMMPVTIPLVLSFIVAQNVITHPDSSIAFWFSLIPLTSPVVMMVRIAFGVPTWELALSIGLLLAGFLAATWLAGKIYRTGILMYGKKVTYKELIKWIFYKG